MSSIKKRLFFLFSIGTLPLWALHIWGYQHFMEVHRLEKKIKHLDLRLEKLCALERKNKEVLDYYQTPSSSYIHQKLESIHLSPSSPKVQFVEKNCIKTSLYQETKETLATPIHVDFDDIQKFLSKIEVLDASSLPNDRPHLIISDFDLKKRAGESNQLYSLDLELLKRDYLF